MESKQMKRGKPGKINHSDKAQNLILMSDKIDFKTEGNNNNIGNY